MIDIRPAKLCDSPQLAEIYAPYCATPISFEAQAPDAGQMEERLRGLWPTHPWLVAQAGEQLLGYAYAGRFSGRAAYDWSVEASIYLDEAVRGRGAGRALYTALFGLLAAQGYRRLLAGITLPNAASVALHERMGLTPVGVYRRVGWKFDRWHDVGWWQCSLIDDASEDQPPTSPMPYSALAPARYESAMAAGIASLR